jgi:hypothetical protein
MNNKLTELPTPGIITQLLSSNFPHSFSFPIPLLSETENSLLRRSIAWVLAQADRRLEMTEFGQIQSLQSLSQAIKALPISHGKISPFFQAYPSFFTITSIIGVHGPKLSLHGIARTPSFESKLLETDSSNEGVCMFLSLYMCPSPSLSISL